MFLVNQSKFINKDDIAFECNSKKLELKGTGTEQIEDKIKQFFPDSKINYSENILKKRTKDIAVNFLSEQGLKKKFLGRNFTKKFVDFLLI